MVAHSAARSAGPAAPRGEGARDGTGRHPEAEALAQEPGDLEMRQPELLVEDHHEGDGLRPELHGGGPQRVGGLQRMATLHPALQHPIPTAKRRTIGCTTGSSS